jgi:hypothetical protein
MIVPITSRFKYDGRSSNVRNVLNEIVLEATFGTKL